MSEDIKRQIVDLLLNSNLEGEELVEKIEPLLSKLIPFNHRSSNPMVACNIGGNIEMRVGGGGTVSQLVELIEKSVSKRKLAFVFFRKIIEEQEGSEKASEISQIRHEERTEMKVEKRKGLDSKSFFDGLMGY